MKKIISSLLILTLSLSVLTACGGEKTATDENNNETTWNTKYEKEFTGSKERVIEANASEEYNMLVSAEVSEGDAKLVIKDENDNVYYTDEKIDSGRYIVTLRNYKNYKVILEGNKFKGKIDTNWLSSKDLGTTLDSSPETPEASGEKK